MTRTGLAVSPARPSTGKGVPDASVRGFIGHLYPLHRGAEKPFHWCHSQDPPTPKSRMRVDTLYCSAIVNFGPDIQSEYAKLCMRQPLLLYIFPFSYILCSLSILGVHFCLYQNQNIQNKHYAFLPLKQVQITETERWNVRKMGFPIFYCMCLYRCVSHLHIICYITLSIVYYILYMCVSHFLYSFTH